jgi:hypothetical protein
MHIDPRDPVPRLGAMNIIKDILDQSPVFPDLSTLRNGFAFHGYMKNYSGSVTPADYHY